MQSCLNRAPSNIGRTLGRTQGCSQNNISRLAYHKNRPKEVCCKGCCCLLQQNKSLNLRTANNREYQLRIDDHCILRKMHMWSYSRHSARRGCNSSEFCSSNKVSRTIRINSASIVSTKYHITPINPRLYSLICMYLHMFLTNNVYLIHSN